MAQGLRLPAAYRAAGQVAGPARQRPDMDGQAQEKKS